MDVEPEYPSKWFKSAYCACCGWRGPSRLAFWDVLEDSRGHICRTFRTQATSCRCGGNAAWLVDVLGVSIMIGCVCHTDIERVMEEGDWLPITS